MPLFWNGGELVIEDADGNTRFNSAEGLFTITDFVSSAVVGSVVCPQVSVTATEFSAPYVDFTTDHEIADISADATTIIGMLRTTVASGSGQAEAADGIWRQCTGTHVQSYRGIGVFNSGLNDNDIMSSLILYSFFCDAGKLYMRERFVMRSYSTSAGDVTMIQRAVTVDFRLWCGLFV